MNPDDFRRWLSAVHKTGDDLVNARHALLRELRMEVADTWDVAEYVAGITGATAVLMAEDGDPDTADAKACAELCGRVEARMARIAELVMEL